MNSPGETPPDNVANLTEQLKHRMRTMKKWLGISVLSIGSMVGGFSMAQLTHNNSPQQNTEITACDKNATTQYEQQDCAQQYGNNGGESKNIEMIIGIAGIGATVLSLAMAHDAAVKAAYIPAGKPLGLGTGV